MLTSHSLVYLQYSFRPKLPDLLSHSARAVPSEYLPLLESHVKLSQHHPLAQCQISLLRHFEASGARANVAALGLITWYSKPRCLFLSLSITHADSSITATKYAHHRATTPFLMFASVGCGTRLIWLMNKASWGLVTAQVRA